MQSYNLQKLLALLQIVANGDPGEVTITMTLESDRERIHFATECIQKSVAFKINGEKCTILGGW